MTRRSARNLMRALGCASLAAFLIGSASAQASSLPVCLSGHYYAKKNKPPFTGSNPRDWDFRTYCDPGFKGGMKQELTFEDFRGAGQSITLKRSDGAYVGRTRVTETMFCESARRDGEGKPYGWIIDQPVDYRFTVTPVEIRKKQD